MVSTWDAMTTFSPGAGMELAELLAGLDYQLVATGHTESAPTLVHSVHVDSRLVEPGGVFVALAGAATDGHRYLGQAIQRGCRAIVVERGCAWDADLTDWPGSVLEVADTHLAYAAIAANFYGRPADKLRLVAVTGTNGKTTITYLLEEVLEKLGFRVGVIGTVNYRYGREGGKTVLAAPNTTPEAMQLQALLFAMTQNGVQFVIMEASSHALAQERIGGLRFDVAAFTNLSHDHLDYHRDMEEYFLAKSRLFVSYLKEDGTAVIGSPVQPADTLDWSGRLAALCREHNRSCLCCGVGPENHLRLEKYVASLAATEVTLACSQGEYFFRSPLVGHFNVDNLLTSYAILLGLGFATEDFLPHLAAAKGAPGRLQRVSVDDGSSYGRPVVFVDYAHTPDAVRQVLATLTALPHRDLFCVFGCGGDRDTAKRPIMGQFAVEYAEVAIISDDNPRTEDPLAIVEHIRAGAEKAGGEYRTVDWLMTRKSGDKGYLVVHDRRQAIRLAVHGAGAGDIVVIAGKGHETYQLNLQGKRHFDDCLEASCALSSWNAPALALATGGVLGGAAAPRPFGAISTDSRTVRPGEIFLALRGEKFDGHAYLTEVRDKGAACLIVEKEPTAADLGALPWVVVDNSLQALGDLAQFRRRFMAQLGDVVVAAITGSCGKTTVKEMVSAILRRKWPAGPNFPEECVLQTKGNLNNLIGLPMSLLAIEPRHKAAVMEMGMNTPGEIARMARIAEPNISCITNVHGVHLEGLGSIEGVARAKEELFAATGPAGTLIVNLDDPHIRSIAARYSQAKITFSVKEQHCPPAADFWATGIDISGAGVITFVLHAGARQADVHLYTVGLHNVANAVCAAAVAGAVGASLDEIATGLADFRPVDKRMEILKTSQGLNLLNDTYNANPASMSAGLETLTRLAVNCRSVAVLGDMLELGASALEAHRQLGAEVAKLGVSYLAVVGEYADQVAAAALTAGMAKERVRPCAAKEEANEWLEWLLAEGRLTPGDWVLVKASRGLKMETIVARLQGKP